MGSSDSDAVSAARELEEARSTIAELRERAERAEALAETYRAAAKARAEEISELLRRSRPTATSSDIHALRREVVELRGHLSRRIVRLVLRVMEPIDRTSRAARQTAARLRP